MDDLTQRLVAEAQEGGEELQAEVSPKAEETEEEVVEESAEAEAEETDAEASDKADDKTEAKEEEFKIDEKTLSDLREQKIIPKHRFDEVLEELRQYKSFGSPDDLRKKMTQAVKETKDEGEPKTLTDKDKAVVDYMMKLFPQMKNLDDVLKTIEAVKAEKVYETNNHLTAAQNAIRDYGIKELGFPANSAGLKLLIEDMASIIHSNPEWNQRFYARRDMTVLDEAKKEFDKIYLSTIRRIGAAKAVQAKKQTASLPKSMGKGTAGTGSSQAPKPKSNIVDMDAIGDAAWEHLTHKGEPGE